MASLASAILAYVDGLLVAGKTTPLFSTETDPSGPYVHDADCWAYPFRDALTCRAVYTTGSSRRAGPTLIAEASGDNRFVAFANHYQPSGTIYFRGTDGTVHARTITSSVLIGTGEDGRIGILNEALPTTVHGAPLADDIWKYLVAHQAGQTEATLGWSGFTGKIPCLLLVSDLTNAAMRAVVQNYLGNAVELLAYMHPATLFNPCTEAQRLDWTETPVDGASGSPYLLPLPDGTVALLSTAMGADPWRWIGPRYSASAVAAAMTSLAGASRSPAAANLAAFGEEALLPTITSFAASPVVIDRQNPNNVTLEWSVTGSTSRSIDQGVGAVAASGSTVVHPSVATNYTLTATNEFGTVTSVIGVSDMGYYITATGLTTASNLAALASWRQSDASGNDMGAASVLPGEGDIIWLHPRPIKGYGTVEADIMAGGDDFAVYEIIGGGSSLVLNGNISQQNEYGESRDYRFTDVRVNGSVALPAAFGVLLSATRTDFYGPVSVAVVSTLDQARFFDRLSLDSGVTWLYAATSPAVAPANKVLTGTSNLGVAGTLDMDRVATSAGTFRRRCFSLVTFAAMLLCTVAQAANRFTTAAGDVTVASNIDGGTALQAGDNLELRHAMTLGDGGTLFPYDGLDARSVMTNTAAGSLTVTGTCTINSNCTAVGANLILQGAATTTSTYQWTGSISGSGTPITVVGGTTTKTLNITGWSGTGMINITSAGPTIITTNGNTLAVPTGSHLSIVESAPGITSAINDFRLSLAQGAKFSMVGIGDSTITQANSLITRTHATSQVFDSTGLLPVSNTFAALAAGDIRAGVVDPSSSLTGTLVVPAPSSVAAGVPVDNTVGTAVLTLANAQAAVAGVTVNAPSVTVNPTPVTVNPIVNPTPVTVQAPDVKVSVVNGDVMSVKVNGQIVVEKRVTVK